MHILEARSLVKTYQDSLQKIEVLKGASITIDEAALISITGKSGSGKSTLLHILGLLDSPDKGDLLYLGTPVSSSSKNAPQLRNKELGFVFQFHYLIDDLSAEENVALPLIIGGQSQAMSLSRARELLKSFGLEDRQKHYLNQLSGGEQQRVSLARALANHPRLVLADEPTGNLDPENSQEIWQTILKLNREQGQAFVIITHDKDSAGLAKSSYSLQNGVLVPQ